MPDKYRGLYIASIMGWNGEFYEAIMMGHYRGFYLPIIRGAVQK
jgi:hypothetical protein